MERVKVPTMSRLVAAMEEEALVRREPHGTDARAVVLHATAKGAADPRARARAAALAARVAARRQRRRARSRPSREAAEIVDRLVL